MSILRLIIAIHNERTTTTATTETFTKRTQTQNGKVNAQTIPHRRFEMVSLAASLPSHAVCPSRTAIDR